MNKSKMIFSVLGILLGGLIVMYGGMDDSPGAQLIGLLVIIVGVVGMVKSRKKNPSQTQL